MTDKEMELVKFVLRVTGLVVVVGVILDASF